MKLDPTKMHAYIKRQSPEARAMMMQATKLSPLVLERWLKDPEADPLSTSDLDMLNNWAFGRFVRMSSKEGYVLVEAGAVATVAANVKAPRFKPGTKVYSNPADEPNSPVGMTIVRAALRGADLLNGPDEAKREAIRRAEQAEIAARKKTNTASPMKRITQTIPLWPGRS